MIDFFLLLGPLGYPLLLCSVLALAIILERSIALFSLPTASKSLRFQRLLHPAVALLEANMGLARETRNNLASSWLNGYAQRVEARLKWLALIAAIAPMIGLLGTVLGMTRSFQAIADHTGPVSPQILSSGLWEAMLTTLVGLTIAIVSLVTNYIFRSRATAHIDAVTAALNRQSMVLDGAQFPSAYQVKRRAPVLGQAAE